MASVTDVLVWMVPPKPKLSPVLSTKRFSPTWLVELPLKEVVGADPVQGKAIAGVAVSVRKDRLIAEARVGAASTEEVRMNARAKNGQLREAAGAQRGGCDGVGIDDVADRGVGLVHQGHGVHFHRGAARAHHQRRIHRRRTATGYQDFRVC